MAAPCRSYAAGLRFPKFRLQLGSRALFRYIPSIEKVKQLSTSATLTAPGAYEPIKRLLIANRGEIACRVIRTARKLGIESVAVYSEADKGALHVAQADAAFCVGPAESLKSYLNKDKILEVAKRSGSQAIHPGYGFLSENTEFALQCQQEGIIFVGPPASAIRDMGIKSTSKAIMSAAGVPIIGGYHGSDQSDERLLKEAEDIGFPVMIKAVRGGGGKGMRIALSKKEFQSQLASARNEARKSFNDDVMLVEKFVENPRHVEVQVFGDKHGNYVYLFERDCSVQRRHQKIIEEAPAPHISAEVRKSLGEAAVRAAQAVNYVGAGTVEFIMDLQQKFYFMEMNTRLQVEHPITEMVTGTDLVEWQLRVAAGERLPLLQSDLRLRGHAFEARLYAEDPAGGFMPGAGPLLHLSPPSAATVEPDALLRVETGVRQGDDVSVHYDPMIAKLVVWGSDRPTALSRLVAALKDYRVVGLSTNLKFLISLATHSEFQAGHVHTNFIKQHGASLFSAKAVSDDSVFLAVLAKLLSRKSQAAPAAMSPFMAASHNSLRLNHVLHEIVQLNHKDKGYTVSVKHLPDGSYMLASGGKQATVRGRLHCGVTPGRTVVVGEIDDRTVKADAVFIDTFLHLFTDQEGHIEFSTPLPKFFTDSQSVGRVGDALAPMPGVIDKVCVTEGQQVAEGETMVIMIAMKMEYSIRAPRSGIVEKIPFIAGTTVKKGSLLVHLKEA